MAAEKEKEADAKAEGKEAEEKPSSGGMKAFMPLILTLVLMPAIAFAMTKFIVLPKLLKAVAAESGVTDPNGTGEGDGQGTGDGKGDGDGKGEVKPSKGDGKTKEKVTMDKIVVNVAGSFGARLLLCSVTLAGSDPDFKDTIDENKAMLRDLASSVLATKTIQDLEKPESRNLIRSEFMSQFNAGLGGGIVEEIYITELAIQ